jgi:hypothetical protein
MTDPKHHQTIPLTGHISLYEINNTDTAVERKNKNLSPFPEADLNVFLFIDVRKEIKTINNSRINTHANAEYETVSVFEKIP